MCLIDFLNINTLALNIETLPDILNNDIFPRIGNDESIKFYTSLV